MARIELQGLAHCYTGTEYALAPTDLEWADGQTHALLGPSGCGKTTLLNVISGLIRPSEGRVLFDGVDVTDTSTRERNVAQVFQFPVVYDTMSVFDNLAFPLRNQRVEESEVRRRVMRIAEVLDLEQDLSRRARKLTTDGKQRLALGRGLVRDEVAAILLDEPLTVIDPAHRWELRQKLREVHETLGRTLIHVTHDQDEALTIADRVVVMNEGRVMQVGTPQELVDAPAHTFVAGFIGSPGMNLVPCEIVDGAAHFAGGRVALPASLASAGSSASGSVEMGIRPEHVVLASAAPGVGGSEQTIAARVERVDDHGRLWTARMRVGAGALLVTGPDGRQPRAGEACGLRLPAERLHLFADGRAVTP